MSTIATGFLSEQLEVLASQIEAIDLDVEAITLNDDADNERGRATLMSVRARYVDLYDHVKAALDSLG